MITVTRDWNTFRRSEWRFITLDTRDGLEVHCENYAELTRPSKRHAFRVVESWNRYDNRRSTKIPDFVPMPDDVIAEAMAQVKVTFVHLEKTR